MNHSILKAALGRSVWLFITRLLTPLIQRCFSPQGGNMKYLQPAVGIKKIFSSATHVRVLSLFSADTAGAMVCERDGGQSVKPFKKHTRSDGSDCSSCVIWPTSAPLKMFCRWPRCDESDPSAPGRHSSTDPGGSIRSTPPPSAIVLLCVTHMFW